jgi:hypothetical protein
VKKRAGKNLSLFVKEKEFFSKQQSHFFAFSKSEFLALSFLKISSLAHWEMPQKCAGSAARNTFAEGKTLAAKCMHLSDTTKCALENP